MYFIAKGDCSVSIRDEKRKEIKNVRKLNPGDQFGEISLVYGCNRTATVSAGNYSTFAKLT
jgi:CRP-like cAMP-binding protein